MRTLSGTDEVVAEVGKELGVGDWYTVTQETVSAFAMTTGDMQWIHIDKDRAAAGPFGATVAHGYLTLSLLPFLTQSTYEFTGYALKVNYGTDRVRFPNPVRVGDRIRLRASLASAAPGPHGLRVIVENTVEIDGGSAPGCVAQTVSLLAPHDENQGER